jgi:hypothetical protein
MHADLQLQRRPGRHGRRCPVLASPGLSIPIVGGSGAYRGASGQLTAGEPVEGFDSVDILHLDG